MKKLLLLSLICAAVAAPQITLHAGQTSTRIQRAVAQAAVNAQEPLISIYWNDSVSKDTFATALGLAALLPPPGQADFTKLRKAQYPRIKDVNVVVAAWADVARQLKANNIPVSSLQNADAYTTSSETKDGKRSITVFLISDVLRSGRTPDQLLATATVAAAHEIYGHVYYKMAHPIDTSNMAKEEPFAYAQSVAFLQRLLASPLAAKLSPTQKQAFNTILAREKKLQAQYK